jgi:hypothetical protein
MEPFRFVHAARLLLDHQLHGTGPMPERLRPIVRDATIGAWENAVNLCLAERVDLLLVTGESIEPRDQSLRGPSALIRGLERLAEQEIPVVIAAGAGDPWESWPGGFRFPANVVRLGIDVADELPITRDGHLLAYLRGDRDVYPTETVEAPWLLKLPDGREQPFSICVSPKPHPGEIPDDESEPRADYRATGGGSVSRTIVEGRNFIHDPGPTQAIRPLETGPRGCTLVSVDAAGTLERRFVPTAPVRFEQLSLSVTPEHTRDDLVLEMIAALERIPRHETDKVWLVAWNILGSGTWIERLSDRVARSELLATLAEECAIEGVAIHSHAVRIYPHSPVEETNDESIDGAGDELLRGFQDRLAQRASRPQNLLERCFDESPVRGGPWESALESLIAELDADDVAHDARRMSQRWFTADEEHPS